MKIKFTFILLALISVTFLFSFIYSDKVSSGKEMVWIVGETISTDSRKPIKGLVVNKYDSKASHEMDAYSYTCETYPRFFIQHIVNDQEAIAGKVLRKSLHFKETYLKIYDPAFNRFKPKIVSLIDVDKAMNGDTIDLGQITMERN